MEKIGRLKPKRAIRTSTTKLIKKIESTLEKSVKGTDPEYLNEFLDHISAKEIALKELGSEVEAEISKLIEYKRKLKFPLNILIEL